MRKTEIPEMFYKAKPDILKKARDLRKNMTEAELLLWEELREKKLGLRFRRQHPIGHFIADFYCHKIKLVIEVDGDIHDQQKEYDIERTKEMNELGIKVIRFTNKEVKEALSIVIEEIKRQFSCNLTPKSPEGDF